MSEFVTTFETLAGVLAAIYVALLILETVDDGSCWTVYQDYNPRVVSVRLPNERNQSISYFLRVFRVTGKILVQKPFLIKKPPY
jgi:hypothetical protein